LLFLLRAPSTFENLQSTNLAPISAGTIDVHADVELTYEVAPVADGPGVKVPQLRDLQSKANSLM